MHLRIGIPTTDSADYIVKTVVRVATYATSLLNIESISVAVCANGETAPTVISVLKESVRAGRCPDVQTLVVQEGAKNAALNALAAHWRIELDPTRVIACFVDDDAVLAPSSLQHLLSAHEAHTRQFGLPVLVGTTMRAMPQSWHTFRTRELVPIAAARAAWWHWVFATPYVEGAPVPAFCEGLCFLTRLADLPLYPHDSTGITDDTFLSNYFAAQGKDAYLSNRVPSILKPPGAIGFIRVASDFAEWRQQQVRVCAGILRSFHHFSECRGYLAELFAWPYAFNPDSVTETGAMRYSQRLRHSLFMHYHAMNVRDATALVASDLIPAWPPALTTKLHA